MVKSQHSSSFCFWYKKKNSPFTCIILNKIFIYKITIILYFRERRKGKWKDLNWSMFPDNDV